MQASSSASSASTAKLTRSDLLRIAQRHPLALAYVAALIPALFMAVTQPVWSRVDEAQHTDFIIQLSHGRYPIADETVIDSETLRVMETTGVFRIEGPGSYPTPDVSNIGPPPAGMSAAANAAWMTRHMWQLSHEADQTPGYYLLMVPVWRIADGLGGTFDAIYVMRLINALLVATLAPMAFVVASAVAPRRLEVAVVAALLAAVLPGLVFDGTRVSNDTLSSVLGALATVMAISWAGRPWTARRVVAIGSALGAAVFVKLTLIVLLPVVVVAMLWPSGTTGVARRVGAAAASAAIAVAWLLPWFLINVHLYGTFLPLAHAHRLTGALPGHFTPGFVVVDIVFFVLTFFGGEPLGELPLSIGSVALGAVLALIAGFGGLAAMVARRGYRPPAAALVAFAAVVTMVATALLLPATSSFEFAGPGRYAYPAVPAAAALCAFGVYTAMARRFASRALSGFYVAAAVATLAVAMVGPWDVADPGLRHPPASAAIVSTNESARAGDVSITVDNVALDRRSGATWFEVVLRNDGPEKIEWSVTPIVSSGNTVAYGDYSKSSQLPGDVDPGSSVSGWLYVPLDPERIPAGQPIHVRFRDVAQSSYRSLADLEVDISIPSGAGRA